MHTINNRSYATCLRLDYHIIRVETVKGLCSCVCYTDVVDFPSPTVKLQYSSSSSYVSYTGLCLLCVKS